MALSGRRMETLPGGRNKAHAGTAQTCSGLHLSSRVLVPYHLPLAIKRVSYVSVASWGVFGTEYNYFPFTGPIHS